jgi:hypothetical protein
MPLFLYHRELHVFTLPVSSKFAFELVEGANYYTTVLSEERINLFYSVTYIVSG